MQRSGVADLPLHGGRVPPWLAERMTKLGTAISESVLYHYGPSELLSRLSDPFWFHQDPHRTAYAEQTLVKPTQPIYEAYNPAIAEVSAEHVFMVAAFDVMNKGMAPEAAIDKAFKRTEAIFAKYPILSS